MSPEEEIDAFWQVALSHARLGTMPGYFGPNTLQVVRPPAWSFGGTPEDADELLQLVLDGTKTATSSAFEDYALEGEEVPTEGALSIVLDGEGRPRVLLSTTQVRVVPFDEVDAEHARAEGEGDRSLEHWRAVHERFFTEHAPPGRAFSPDMPVVLERFAVLHQQD